MKTKKCDVCQEEKLLTRYYTDPDSDDMHMPVCRSCCGCPWDLPEDQLKKKRIGV